MFTPSCPGLSRASTSFFDGRHKTWMAGTSPAMTTQLVTGLRSRHRPWVARGPAAGFGQRDEAFDRFIEQRGLLEIEHVARFRKDRQSGRRQVFLQEHAGLDAIVVLVAADDQGRR